MRVETNPTHTQNNTHIYPHLFSLSLCHTHKQLHPMYRPSCDDSVERLVFSVPPSDYCSSCRGYGADSSVYWTRTKKNGQRDRKDIWQNSMKCISRDSSFILERHVQSFARVRERDGDRKQSERTQTGTMRGGHADKRRDRAGADADTSCDFCVLCVV